MTVKTPGQEKRYCRLCCKKESRKQCAYGGKLWDKYSVKDATKSEQEDAAEESGISNGSNGDSNSNNSGSGGDSGGGGMSEGVMTKKQIKKRDEIADAISSRDMKKRYGDKNVKYAIATKLAMKEKVSTVEKPHKHNVETIMRVNAIQKIRGKEKEKNLGHGSINEKSKSGDSSLRDWFSKSRSSDGTPGWVQLGGKYAGKPCAKQPGQTTKPKCGSSKMKRNLNKKEEDAAFRRKNAKDPNPNRKGKAINVKTESTQIHEGEKDACYHKVKSRYSVWPSAYASGALVKCRKVGAKNWGNKSKKEEFEGNLSFQEFQEKSMKCWKGYEKKGTQTLFGKKYNRCVKKEETENVEEGAAWTKKSGQNKSGGLNEKGRKSYERENPGSDLKAPSKKVGNPRRASFCARMKGMKAKLTSAKTARDPDSRINKSLRAWNC